MFDYCLGPFSLGWIDTDTFSYNCTQIFPCQNATPSAESNQRARPGPVAQNKTP